MGQARIGAAILGAHCAASAACPIPLSSPDSNIDGFVHDNVPSSGLARFRLSTISVI